MFKLSRLEKIVFLLTFLFVLGTFGWFQMQSRDREVTRVSLSHSPENVISQEDSDPAPGLLEGEKINLNTASAADLTRLPDIGEKRAESIVEYREKNGPFHTVQDLEKVSGIGPGILSEIQDYVTAE